MPAGRGHLANQPREKSQQIVQCRMGENRRRTHWQVAAESAAPVPESDTFTHENTHTRSDVQRVYIDQR